MAHETVTFFSSKIVTFLSGVNCNMGEKKHFIIIIPSFPFSKIPQKKFKPKCKYVNREM